MTTTFNEIIKELVRFSRGYWRRDVVVEAIRPVLQDGQVTVAIRNSWDPWERAKE